MDGQRRIARPLGRAPVKLQPLRWRILARFGAVVFLAATIFHGASSGGHLDYDGSPFGNLTGKLAGVVGLAAEDISITGLTNHDAQQVLDAIGVKPGSSLIGFDARAARAALRRLDWIRQAEVQRVFPNRIDISLAEREAFAIWQFNGVYQVIGRDGVPLTGLDPRNMQHLPLVTGPGANVAAADFVNQMSALPQLFVRVHAAARVGQRRWNLYLDNGVKIALPEQGLDVALKQVAALDARQGILGKGIREIDVRQPGRLIVALAVAESEANAGVAAKSTATRQ